jgi:hypothetical protein
LASNVLVSAANSRHQGRSLIEPRITSIDRTLLLDAAARWSPDVADREQLLHRHAEEGHLALASAELAAVAGDRRGRVVLALERIPSLVDVDLLLADAAWS